MKKLIVLVLFFTNFSGFSQKNFHGTIEYLMTSPDSTVNVHILSYYQKHKIKFVTTVKKIPPGVDLKNETIILNFQDSVIDRIKFDEKFVERERMLAGNSKADIPFLTPDSANRLNILGYECIRFVAPDLSKDEVKDGEKMKAEAKLAIWYAEDLRFDIPDILRNIQMVPLFTNDKIAMGSEIEIAAGNMKLQLKTRAISIKKRNPGKTVFRYPKGFEIRQTD